MRTVAALITVLFTGVVSLALATEPPPMSPSAGQAAPTAAGQQSATTPDSQQSTATPAAQTNAAAPASDSTTIKPPVTVVSSKPGELTPQEKEIVSRGYKLEIRHGERYFCRKEQQIGSRFETKSCDTAQSIEAHRQESQEVLRTIQTDRPQVGK
jgi:hypothetical protein